MLQLVRSPLTRLGPQDNQFGGQRASGGWSRRGTEAPPELEEVDELDPPELELDPLTVTADKALDTTLAVLLTILETMEVAAAVAFETGVSGSPEITVGDFPLEALKWD